MVAVHIFLANMIWYFVVSVEPCEEWMWACKEVVRQIPFPLLLGEKFCLRNVYDKSQKAIYTICWWYRITM